MEHHSPEQWSDFEKKINSLFTLKGFEIAHDVRLAGRQTDLLLKSKEEHVGRILVECKFHDPATGNRVGVRDVEHFAARVLRLRSSGDVNVGYLVTNSDFTADAKGAFQGRPEQHFVLLRTLAELQKKIIDFTPYLTHLIRQYEESNSFDTYEELDAVEGSATNRFPLIPAFQQFAEDSHDGNMAILIGDYGSGKTTTARRLAYLLASQALAPGYTGRIPCLIPLQYFSYTGTASSLILEFLSKEAGIRNIAYDAFDEMNRAGALLLILDGFDEMAKRVTRQVREESFRTLGDLWTQRSKLVITGRAGYFPAHTEFFSAVDMIRSSSSIAAMRRVLRRRPSKLTDILLFAVCPLDTRQIKSFLHKKLRITRETKAEKVDAILDQINSIYNLAELAQRPILLEMIAETLSLHRQQRIRTVVQLYDAYTGLWLDIDIAKGQFRTLISSQLRMDFALHLAWQMFERGTEGMAESIHFIDLSEIVAAHFELDEPEDVDHFSSDVRTCSFLHRDNRGHYSFSHRSFFEYFLAKYLVRTKNRQGAVFRTSFASNFTVKDLFERVPNISHFLSPMMGYPLDPAFWKQVADATEAKTDRLEMDSEDEHDWYLMVSDLAEGNTPLDALGESEVELQRVYQILSRFVRRHSDGLASDDWERMMVTLVTKQEKTLGKERAATKRRKT